MFVLAGFAERVRLGDSLAGDIATGDAQSMRRAKANVRLSGMQVSANTIV
jgi:hypothetical protein